MKAAMILSGCGVLDGSEIHESVLLLLALTQKGYKVDFFSLDKDIEESISHFTKKPIEHKRSMMDMSGRIARGDIKDMELLKADDYDLLAIPGGFGAASNFSDYATKGNNCTVDRRVRDVILDFYNANKAIFATCIAPMIVGRVLEGSGIKMTAGTDSKELTKLASLGIEAVECKADEACVDEKAKVYSAPAYMVPEADVKAIYNSFQKITEVL